MNSSNNRITKVLFLSPFYRWRNHVTSRVTEPVPKMPKFLKKISFHNSKPSYLSWNYYCIINKRTYMINIFTTQCFPAFSFKIADQPEHLWFCYLLLEGNSLSPTPHISVWNPLDANTHPFKSPSSDENSFLNAAIYLPEIVWLRDTYRQWSASWKIHILTYFHKQFYPWSPLELF